MSSFPEVAVSSPAMQRRLVVFPQPEGPTREKNSFSPMLNDTPSTAVKSPNTFLSCSTATDSDTDSSYTLISSPDSHWVIRYMMMIIGRMPTASALARPGNPESCMRKIHTPIVSFLALQMSTETVSSLKADMKMSTHAAIIPG